MKIWSIFEKKEQKTYHFLTMMLVYSKLWHLTELTMITFWNNQDLPFRPPFNYFVSTLQNFAPFINLKGISSSALFELMCIDGWKLYW